MSPRPRDCGASPVKRLAVRPVSLSSPGPSLSTTSTMTGSAPNVRSCRSAGSDCQRRSLPQRCCSPRIRGKSVRRTGPRPQLGRRDALMCGGCGGAPLDWAAELVSGPRQRTAVARRIGGLLRRDTVRAITAGWVVSSPTGASVVCRTYDDLVDAVSERSDRPISEVRAHGLADYTNVCHNRLFRP